MILTADRLHALGVQPEDVLVFYSPSVLVFAVGVLVAGWLVIRSGDFGIEDWREACQTFPEGTTLDAGGWDEDSDVELQFIVNPMRERLAAVS